MKTKTILLTFLMIVSVAINAQEAESNDFYLKSDTKETLSYIESTQDFDVLSKVSGNFSFKISNDFDYFYVTTSTNSKNEIYEIYDFEFAEDQEELTLYVTDENEQEEVIVVNEQTMKLVITHTNEDGGFLLSRYSLTYLGFEN